MFSSIEDAVKDIARGRIIIIVDDEHRENEGDLVMSASLATPSRINFMIKKGGGLITVPITKERAHTLELDLMVPQEENTEITKCKFTISVDLKEGATTGISAADRAMACKALADENVQKDAFARPGHVFPLVAEQGGVLKREGHTEAAIDICELANLSKAGVLCEILDEKGDAMRLPELVEFAKQYKLQIISIEQLIKHRKGQAI